MARTRGVASADQGQPRSIALPSADLDALVTRTTWPTGTEIHRVHPALYRADEFNPGVTGNARFSPICDAVGAPVPTIYGGSTFECAVMETVFHDVPFAAGLKTLAKRKLKRHVYSVVTSSEDLVLADLSNRSLRKLGIPRRDLIDTEKDIYPQTRIWAEAIHAQCRDVHGLFWVSRQDDTARAVVLFADRLDAGVLASAAPSLDIVVDQSIYARVVALADGIGLKITGK